MNGTPRLCFNTVIQAAGLTKDKLLLTGPFRWHRAMQREGKPLCVLELKANAEAEDTHRGDGSKAVLSADSL